MAVLASLPPISQKRQMSFLRYYRCMTGFIGRTQETQRLQQLLDKTTASFVVVMDGDVSVKVV